LLLAILPCGKSYLFSEPFSAWRIHGLNYSVRNETKEKQVAKTNRLMKSSFAVLEYIQKNNYDKQILTIYRLQNATR
jgi:uncharacterized phage-associated protein